MDIERVEYTMEEFNSQADLDARIAELKTAGYEQDGGTPDQRSILSYFIAGGRWILLFVLLFWIK